MNAFARSGVLVVLGASLSTFGLAGVRAEPAPQPREVGKQVMPERVFQEIVKESTRFIQAALTKEPSTKPRPALPAACNVSITSARTIRANALLIALAAQNRILSVGTGPDAAKLATVRDAAVKLAIAVAKNPTDNPDLLTLIAILSQYPDLKADPHASLALVRFKGTFTHDDIASIFSGCGGNRTQLIERHMLKLLQPKALFAPGNVEKLELLAYKVALLADVIRDMDDMIPASDTKVVEHRQEWVRFASEVHQEGWQLAETVRDGNVAEMRQRLTKLDKACAACHDKFRR
ncbi:MAG: hypothetical protein C0467_23360 [Planctomycetaceae bacterium]|nr:hypothetical protein [Planctomycetaceae bacterium]